MGTDFLSATTMAELGLTWLAQSSFLLAIGLIAGRACRRFGPAIQSAIYRTTLVATLLCPLASVLLTTAGVEGVSFRLASEPPSPAPMASPASPASESQPREESRPDPLMSRSPEPLAERAPDSLAETPPPALPMTEIAEPAVTRAIARFTLADGLSAAFLLWLAGSMALAIRLAVQQRRMRRLRTGAVLAGRAEQDLCGQVARQMEVPKPHVWRSPYLFSPCLDGIRRPAILLPEDAGENLRDTFVHELAHLARRDGLWNLLRRAAVAAFWFQPLLWVLSRRLETTAEEVCDDYVVQLGGDRALYASHLVELARRDLPPLSPAGVGMISLRSMLARRVVRILDTSRSLSTRAGRRAVVGTLAVGLVITTAAGLLGIGGRPPAAEAQMTEREAAEQMIEKSEGQIFGPDGKPFPGATVLVWSSEPLWPGINDFSDDRFDRIYTVKRTVTDKDGRYSLTLDKPEVAKNLQFLAMAPGHRPTVFHEIYLRKGFKVQLAEGDQPIEGQVIDLEGRPVPNVRVRIAQLYLQNADNPPTEDLRLLNGRNVVNSGEPLLPGGVTTDAEGRFQIKGLGRDTVVLLKIFGQTIATKNVQVMTRDMATIPAPGNESDSRELTDPAMYGARCTITVEPTRPIAGVVRDKETNEPIPGVVVTALALSNSTASIVGEVATTTDAEGRYRLVGLPKEGSSGHRLTVYPPVDRPYFVTSDLEPAPQPGFDPITFDIALRKGIWITGQVKKTTASKPVAASVEYFPMLDNPIAADYSNFNPRIASIAISTRHKTDSDGRYRVPGLPGEGVVTVHTEDREAQVGVGSESIKKTEYGNLLTYNQLLPSLYQVVKPVNIPREIRDFRCDLIVESGGSVKLRLVDPEGKPVNTAAVWGRYPTFVDNGDHNLYDESLVKISGLEPGKPRLVLIRDHSRKLGVILTVPGSRDVVDQEQAVTLRPTATIMGRLVDAQGKPASGEVRIEYQQPFKLQFGNQFVDSVKLDADGRFRSEVVPAGDRYHISATDPNGYGFPRRMNENSFDQFVLGESIKAASGQTVDLGTFDTSTGKRIEESKPARTDEENVSITGQIVDLEGQPVAGATVTVAGVKYPKNGNLTDWLKAAQAGEAPWVSSRLIDWDRKEPELKGREARTDADGRFQLPGFGKEEIVTLSLRSESVAMTVFDVVTRQVDSFQASGYKNQYGPGTMTVHGINFIHTTVPSRLVEGVVKDAATKQPLADVEVRSYRFAGSDFIGTMPLKQKTDANGRFRMESLPMAKGNVLLLVPNDEQPYFLHEFSLPDLSPGDSAPVEIGLHRGIWIEGKLTDASTGKPIPDARLHYLPFLGNRFAEAVPEFGEDWNVHGTGFQERYLTKADGSFRLVGLPGRAIIGAAIAHKEETFLNGSGADAIEGMNESGHFETYHNPIMPGRFWPNVMREINPAADDPEIHVDLQAKRGVSVKVRLVDRSGEPVNGSESGCRASRGSYDRGTMESEGLVTNLQADEERTVYFLHKDRKLGKVIRVRPGDDAKGPVVVTLEPLATIMGRVADKEGLPYQGATIRPDLLPGGDFGPRLSDVSSGSDGRFIVENVPVGCDYGLAVDSQGPISSRRFAFHSKAEVKPGETTDVGDISFKE